MGRHQETRLKLSTNKSKSAETEHKVDSKLAKTNANGQIECIICKVAVKSAALWKVHVNSKLHKERIMLVKQIKSNFQGGGTAEAGAKVSTNATKTTPKATEKPTGTHTTRTTTTNTQQMLSKTSTTTTTTPLQSSAPTGPLSAAAAATNVSEKTSATTNNIDTLLPEKFFDDPVKDAKIRNTEYKDPQADEWERFQREIREASSVSVAIIAGEQIESAYDRDLEEINDQMIHWSRYIHLEARKGVLHENKEHKIEAQSSDGDSESDDETVTTTEFSDWRSKAFI
ncbi:zinc finger protein 830 [Ceratitis capitata]|uniref:Zinc finger protein 830 n=1 Tax=Ceratitis capitata TaxID=7213 RepID=A0A811U725_CERCA|nr:zinc finger protein 830 [Ceratitis capitata]XP_020717353.1 zinc finger protein 830 [Ceratitis capitata]CAD6993787.1 unnamed protein product [Ceratitis capitata]